MSYILLFLLLSIILALFVRAQDESNSSITRSSWFWPLLSVCLVLLITVPCTLGLVAYICQMKSSSEDSSSVQAVSSSSSALPRRRRRNRRRRRHQQDDESGQTPPVRPSTDHGIVIISPPPPYIACEPPPYQSPAPPAPPPTATTEPIDPLPNTSLETTENPVTVIETSASLNMSSMQTFQA